MLYHKILHKILHPIWKNPNGVFLYVCYNINMFSKHLLKVILGFCGMIILGLVVLVILDGFK